MVSSSVSARFLYGFPYRFQRAWTVLCSVKHPLDVVRVGAWNSLPTHTQSALPASPPATQEYPIQLVVADYFHLAGRRFPVYTDRYTGWVAVSEPAQDRNDGRTLICILREWFGTYWVPEEISTDGDPPFTSYLVCTFITFWDIRSQLSSAYYPQSNGHAELAVKVTKHIFEYIQCR